MCVCVCVCLSLAAFPYYCTDPDVSWGNGRGCPLVVHCLADLQSVHEFRRYDNIARTRNVSNCLYSVYAWFPSGAHISTRVSTAVVQRDGSTRSFVPPSVADFRTRYSGLPSTSPWTARVCAGVVSTCRPASSRTSCSGNNNNNNRFVCLMLHELAHCLY